VLPVIAAALCSLACSTSYRAPEAALHTELREVEFPSTSPVAVEIYVRGGLVLIQDGTRLQGDVQIAARGDSDSDAQEHLQSIRLLTTEENDVCRLRATPAIASDLDAVDIRFRMQVPAHIKVRVFTHHADVAVRGYRGDAEVQTETGEIQARPDGGTCMLSTVSGAIRLGGTFRRAALTTHDGNIGVTLPPERHDVMLQATSDSGSVSLDLSETCRMLLSYTTQNGILRTDFPVVWHNSAAEEDRVYEGTIGDAGKPISVDATVHCRAGEFEVKRWSVATPPARG
jgi:hypothetical protein